jgi:hypothetical protein
MKPISALALGNSWDTNGTYKVPDQDVYGIELQLPDDAPDCWLSVPGGDYFLAISFHFHGHHHDPVDSNVGDLRITRSPFVLNHLQDPYNYFALDARSAHSYSSPLGYWDWLPGIMVVDTSERYCLPDAALVAFAGCEWADNDFRIRDGLWDHDFSTRFTMRMTRAINDFVGPGQTGWPFGERQYEHCVLVWVHADTGECARLALLSIRQGSVKHAYLHDIPGVESLPHGWLEPPERTWDWRQSVRFLYQAKLMLYDALPESAITMATAALENATFEIVRFAHKEREGQKSAKAFSYIQRLRSLLPSLGFHLPAQTLSRVENAYRCRNKVVHELADIEIEDASEHIEAIETAIRLYVRATDPPA